MFPFILILLAVHVPTLATAQESLNVPALLDQAAAAMGVGPASITSLEAAGTYTVFRNDGPFTRSLRAKVLGFDKVRWELDDPDGTVVTVVRSNGGWTETNGVSRHLSVSQVAGRRLEYLPTIAIAEWVQTTRTRSAAKGQVDIGGRAYERVYLERLDRTTNDEEFKENFRRMFRREVFLDSQTSLPARLRYFSHPGDWRIDRPVDLVYSNYQNVGGVLVPLTITRYMSDIKISEVQFMTFTPNAPVSESDFQRR